MKGAPGECSHNKQIPQPVDPSARGMQQGDSVNYVAQWPLSTTVESDRFLFPCPLLKAWEQLTRATATDI